MSIAAPPLLPSLNLSNTLIKLGWLLLSYFTTLSLLHPNRLALHICIMNIMIIWTAIKMTCTTYILISNTYTWWTQSTTSNYQTTKSFFCTQLAYSTTLRKNFRRKSREDWWNLAVCIHTAAALLCSHRDSFYLEFSFSLLPLSLISSWHAMQLHSILK